MWAAVLIVIFVQTWWAMFGLRAHTDWDFLDFLIVLLQTITLYMMAAVLRVRSLPITPGQVALR